MIYNQIKKIILRTNFNYDLSRFKSFFIINYNHKKKIFYISNVNL